MQLLSFRNVLIFVATAFALFMAYSAWNKADAGSWTGCYVGGVGSYNALVEDGGGDGVEGPGIAATVGCDIEREKLVLGAWGEYGLRRSDTGTGGDEADAQGWAAGGRIGYLVHQHTLLYALAGWTDLTLSEDGWPDVDASGVLVGGGMEVPLGGGFFARGEYQYLMLEADDYGDEANLHSGRLGLVWKFGGPEQVIQAVDAPFTAPKPAPLK
jgi:hypothetical protein